MLGTSLHFGRSDDRFYTPAKARRSYPLSRPAGAAAFAAAKPAAPARRELENRTGPPSLASSCLSSSSSSSSSSNLNQFLESTVPLVPLQYLSKTRMRGWSSFDLEVRAYFSLGDLWEAFKEWSAYGAGVKLVLDGAETVVQYYVPYLSGIQLYGDSSMRFACSRRVGEESDSVDSSSDASSDFEPEKGLKPEDCSRNHLSCTAMLRMDRLSVGENHIALQEGFSSDDGEAGNSHGCLLFEYLEQDLPYSREPLADKISDLASCFPELKTLRSCDLLPSSWISVAWYPIYRIPTGPTLKDFDACFLSFHSLSIPMKGAGSAAVPNITYPQGADGVPRIPLPAFGLASYKLKGSIWTSNGGSERQLASSLQQAADNWLQLLRVYHPDYQFFASHGAGWR